MRVVRQSRWVASSACAVLATTGVEKNRADTLEGGRSGFGSDPDQLGAVMSNFGFPSSEDRLDTEPRGRVCATDGCDTILSRYNRADHCGVHENGLVVAARPRTRVSRLGHDARSRTTPAQGDGS